MRGVRMSTDKDKQPYGTVLLKADRILEFLASCNKSQTLNQIAKATDLTNSTALKILDTLNLIGYVQKDLESKKFSLGSSLIKYANKAINQLDIKKIAQGHLEELQKTTSETVHLGILDKSSVVYVTKIDSSNPIMLYSQIGKNIPLYCSAMGKAILADLSDREVIHYLDENHPIKKTKNTIIEKGVFLREINKIRELGYAFDNGEHEEEVFCIGASITVNGKNFGAISVSTPKYRLTDISLERTIHAIQACKAAILAELQ
jgi:DNA-binding IclR family transcriptional regulator